MPSADPAAINFFSSSSVTSRVTVCRSMGRVRSTRLRIRCSRVPRSAEVSPSLAMTASGRLSKLNWASASGLAGLHFLFQLGYRGVSFYGTILRPGILPAQLCVQLLLQGLVCRKRCAGQQGVPQGPGQIRLRRAAHGRAGGDQLHLPQRRRPAPWITASPDNNLPAAGLYCAVFPARHSCPMRYSRSRARVMAT